MLTREFHKLFVGEAISAVGSAITQIALPLTAALTLAATPQQMGFLVAAGWLPYLLFSLFAGAWSDRLPRRPILIVTDLARAAILVTIPLAAVAGRLSIEHVLVAAFLAGSMTVLFQSAYRPFLPVLVGRDALVAANSRLALADSGARVAGPGLGGLLVQTLTAPFAILVDAATFIASAIAVSTIRVRETAPERSARRSIFIEIAEGMRVVLANRFIRSVMIVGLLFNFSITLGDAVYVLYATRSLGLDGALFGGVFTVGGIAAIAGTTVVQRITSRLGIGRAMLGSLLLITVAGTLVLVAGGPPIAAASYLAARAALSGFGAILFNVTSGSVTQAAVPDRLLGRVGGATQVVGLGMIPVAALIGGWLGDHIGLWNTLAVSCAAQFVAFAFVAASPLRTIRTTGDLPVIGEMHA